MQPVTHSCFHTVLPSGVNKVQRFAPTPNENRQRMANAGGIGITGTIDPNTDYAYALAFQVGMGLAKRYPNPRYTPAMITPNDAAIYDGPFALAARLDGSCVVIDFSDLPPYLLENNRDDAGVCNWQVTSPHSKRKEFRG